MSRIDELLVKFLLNETTTVENTEVQQWIDQDPANRSYFEHFSRIWETSKKLERTSVVDEEAAWLKFKVKTSAEKPPVKVLPLKRKTYGWLKIAAVFLLAAGAWGAWTLFGQGSYVRVEAGQQVLVKTLPDGSVLTMNKRSVLSFASNFKENRSIHLQQGDVFFSVTPNKKKPFIIEVNKVSVKVVGTSFNVKHSGKQTEVIVETGIVKVSYKNEQVELHPGEKVRISEENGALTKQQNTDQLYNYYRSRLFILQNTPLSSVATTLNDAYQANVVIEDPKVQQLILSTTLKLDNSLDYNLGIICKSLNLKTTNSQGKILLSNR
nr:FecR domain-containing protein [Pedobacter sp. ASV19]